MATRGVALTATFMAINSSTGAEVTGDGPNITPRKVKDGTSSSLTSATVTEVDSTNFPGLYSVAISSTEADCNLLVVGGKSSTANVKIIPTILQMERLPDAAPGTSGGVPTTDSSNGVKISVGTGTGQINLSSGNVPSTVSSIATDAITSSSLASSAITEIQAGLSTLDAAGVRTALGLASANLDTQLSNINSKTTNLPSDPATATATTAIKAVVDTIATSTQDFPTMITGDGTAGAKFTTTALSNAPGGGGGALTTEQERMFCIIAGMMGFGTAVKTVVDRNTVSQTFTVPNIDLTDSGDEVTITIVKNSSSQQTATASIA